MPHVLAMGGDVAQFTGGASEFEVAATTFGDMVRELESRWPGLGEYVERRMAIAIDGAIFQDAEAAVLVASSEICLIPKIGGG
jgi:molybdopterin converting factor small subunit